MRVLTNSPFNTRGLISIVEADENVPQTVVFCIPIDIRDAEEMRDISDFGNYFSRGISTKIKGQEGTSTIYLDYKSPRRYGREINPLPRFVANIKGYLVDFYLSPLNFLQSNGKRLSIDFIYSGKYLNDELSNKRLIIIEPNWRQLDRLFLETQITFTDWK